MRTASRVLGKPQKLHQTKEECPTCTPILSPPCPTPVRTPTRPSKTVPTTSATASKPPSNRSTKNTIPPIVIQTPKDLRKMFRDLNADYPGGFTAKLAKRSTLLYYDRIVNLMKDNNIQYHTYSKKSQKTHAFVLRGIAPGFTENEILEDLCRQAVPVEKVRIMRTKSPLPLFLVVTAASETVRGLQQRPKCANCGGDHAACNTECPVYIYKLRQMNPTANAERDRRQYVPAPQPTTNLWTKNDNQKVRFRYEKPDSTDEEEEDFEFPLLPSKNPTRRSQTSSDEKNEIPIAVRRQTSEQPFEVTRYNNQITLAFHQVPFQHENNLGT